MSWHSLGVVIVLFSFVTGVAHAAELYGTLKKIKDTGTINLGHRGASVPFAYMDDTGKPIGYSMDLCTKVIDKIKEELGMPGLKITLVSVTSRTWIPLLANGTIDIECGSTTNNFPRQKQIDYLPITFITGTKIAVKKGSGIKEIKDLNGKAVALSLGTTHVKAIKAAAKDKGINLTALGPTG